MNQWTLLKHPWRYNMNKKINDYDFQKTESGNIIGNDKNRYMMRDLLNSKGPGFCLAKWTQVTMHLGAGLTHSCHHPVAHKIPIEELEKDPGALHNTNHKKEQRKAMLNGERPAECDFCWRIEDNTGNISDRVLKSMDSFSIVDHDSITELTGDENIYPRYVEVSFSNVCNFKCSYCGPTFSSKWADEIKNQGAYDLGAGGKYNWVEHMPLKASEDNPYTKAFWKWFPDALPHMHTFRITGGEPLLSKHTLKTLRHMIENPNPNLEVAVNSNACPPGNLWKEFTDVVNELLTKKCIKKFTLFVSAESVGQAAEFSRTGMDWNLFTSNVEYFLENTIDTRITFMSAFNIFSITTIKEFLEYTLYLKKKYNKDGMTDWLLKSGIDPESFMLHGIDTQRNDRSMKTTNISTKDLRVGIDIPYVRAPDFLDPQIATIDLVEKFMLPAVSYMYQHTANTEWINSNVYETWESLKLKRIFVDMLIACKDSRNADETTQRQDIATKRARFFAFIKEYEKRRGVNFLDVFPDMKDFLKVCELEHAKELKQ